MQDLVSYFLFSSIWTENNLYTTDDKKIQSPLTWVFSASQAVLILTSKHGTAVEAVLITRLTYNCEATWKDKLGNSIGRR